MLVELAMLVLGLIALAKSSDFIIKNAVRFSKASGINEMAIGFIFIAVATSLPEMSIAVLSSVSKNGALSMGNLIGADITNISLIFGIVAFIGFKIRREDLENISLAIILVSIVALFLIILRNADLTLGVFLLILFYLFSRIVLDSGIKISNKFKTDKRNLSHILVFIFVGVAVVIISANVVTQYAILFASALGVQNALIGATILAIGTTLPELSVNLAAIRRKNPELAIGNSIGSIVTNMTLILGIASVINPIAVSSAAFIALLYLLFVSAIFVFIANRLKFSRKEGIILLIIYLSYLIVLMKV